ncbi:HpcH/HpaI aldolase/citrate lyase family protein [Pararhodonellum marinum]|uniref:HpcH/HpaI aldolase/citrate lyase family protein n=1 Tax=Pararhodonellum marinum TaxID=2755358 RepID=UPI00188F85D5|nr:HpcH/HpaI aldolase/citrate lyase family protein [Pararhodonellum marinum]
MKHNSYNNKFVFLKEPISFNKYTDKSILQFCLGATLYMPGTKNILGKILSKSHNLPTSLVMDFEDAIEASALHHAELNVLDHLDKIDDALQRNQIVTDDLPLIFLRVRDTHQFTSFAKKIKKHQAEVLTGFVFPKFYSYNAFAYLNQLEQINAELGVNLYGMPILEGRAIAYKESRTAELQQLHEIVEPSKKHLLNIRVGGTDFSSIFGVRRSMNSSIYDILTVRDCLSDILNFFNRDTGDYTVSAPVWEYFLAYKQDNIEKLIEKDLNHSILSRTPIINEAVDGLLREVLIDKANGFVGKTIIHPSHIKFVNALQAVTREEFEDAEQIVNTEGGVIKSAKSNKMNEINPHKNWANKVLNRAKVYGVIEDEKSFIKLLV